MISTLTSSRQCFRDYRISRKRHSLGITLPMCKYLCVVFAVCLRAFRVYSITFAEQINRKLYRFSRRVHSRLAAWFYAGCTGAWTMCTMLTVSDVCGYVLDSKPLPTSTPERERGKRRKYCWQCSAPHQSHCLCGQQINTKTPNKYKPETR